MQIWPIQLMFPHSCLPPMLSFLDDKENGCSDHCQGWVHKVLMYWNHIVEKIVFYNTSKSNEPLIYNGAFYLHRVVYIVRLVRTANVAWSGVSGVRSLIRNYSGLFGSKGRHLRRSGSIRQSVDPSVNICNCINQRQNNLAEVYWIIKKYF